MQSEYIDDAIYPDFFHREMTPVWLSTAATALGRTAPDPGRAFTWMELGCGAGFGTLLTAAACPMGRFIGIDIDARHIERALARARAANIRNAEFLRDDVVRLAADPGADLPACDYIVLHGVYSWVAPDVQRALLRIVQRCLKPGGLLHLGYMSHPGPSVFMAAQRLMRLHARQSTGSSTERAPAALDFLRRLETAGAGYFSANPAAGAQLARVADEAPGYLAHEFLNAHWQPQHVADVMAQCESVGCRYVGSATLLENMDAVSIPAATQPLLQTLQDPALAETVRDLARNQSLRRDIYQRTDGEPGRHILPPAAHRERLMAQVIAPLPGMPARGPLTLDTRIGQVEAPAALFDPALAALQRGAESLATLARLPDYAAHPGALNQVSQTLYGAGWAHPAPAAVSIDAAPAWRLNRWLAAEVDGPCWLAAPALGSAVWVSDWQRRAARVLLDVPGIHGAALWAALPQRAAAQPAPDALDDFERNVLPLWYSYGVVPRMRVAP